MKKFIGSKRAVVGLCAVLVAVSAFFYAPMDVSAAEINEFDYVYNRSFIIRGDSIQKFTFTLSRPLISSDSSFYDDIDEDVLYAVNVLTDNTFDSLYPFEISSGNIRYTWQYLFSRINGTSVDNSFNSSASRVIYLLGSDLINPSLGLLGDIYLSGIDSNVNSFIVNYSLGFKVRSVTPITGADSESYMQGYNAGYSAGEQVGESNGYSNGYSEGYEAGEQSGYDSGFEAGEQSGYDSGFQAGQDSVDTQSYYDLGYSVGYDAGYLSGYDDGYDDGYDVGYEQAVSNLTKYGADATTYPIHLGTVSDTNTHVTLEPIYNQPADMTWIPYEFDISSYKIDPLYNYRILGLLDEFCFGGQFYQYSKASVFLQVGGKDYYIGSWSGGYDTKFSPGFQIYVPGSEMGTKLAIKVIAYNCAGTSEKQQYSYPYINLITTKCTMTVSNMGPASAEANQIANQTDVLNNTLEEQTEVLEEQAETQKGIAKSLKDFFGSFFDNFVDSVIGIFVPSTEEMESLFNRLNDFFAETFGFLYYPFDFIIDAFNIFMEADSGTGLTLPSFSIMGYEVWGNQTYDLNSEPLVGEIFGYVRIGTGALLAMWFVNYLRNFFDKRFGGGGS